MGTLMMILILALVVGAMPRWGYVRYWEYGPGGALGFLLLILLLLLLMGNFPHRY